MSRYIYAPRINDFSEDYEICLCEDYETAKAAIDKEARSLINFHFLENDNGYICFEDFPDVLKDAVKAVEDVYTSNCTVSWRLIRNELSEFSDMWHLCYKREDSDEYKYCKFLVLHKEMLMDLYMIEIPFKHSINPKELMSIDDIKGEE